MVSLLSREVRSSWVACMIGTLVMDIVVIIEYYMTGEPLNTSLVLYGALIGAGVWIGFVLHILFGSALGIIFGLFISRFDFLRIDSIGKGLWVGLAAGLVTIPLGCVPFALIVGVPLLKMISMVTIPHVVWGLVMGGLTGYLLGCARATMFKHNHRRGNSTPIIQLAIVALIILLGAIWFFNTNPQEMFPGDDSTTETSELETPVTQEPELEPIEPDDPSVSKPFTVTWKSLNGPSGGAVPLLVLNPSRKDEVYAGSFPGLFVSRDHGDTFQQLVDTSLGPINSLEAYHDTLYFTTNNAFSVNIDTGQVSLLREGQTQLWIQDGKVYVSSIIYHNDETWIEIEYADLSSNPLTWSLLPSLDQVYSTIISSYQGSIELSPELYLGNLIETNTGLTFTIGVNDKEEKFQYLKNQLIILDETNTWNIIDLEMGEELCISKIVQDPEDFDHLVMVLRYRERGSKPNKPLSDLIKESTDGGYTWTQYTEIEDPRAYLLKDADIIDGSLYLPRVQDFIVRLFGEDHSEVELLPMASPSNQVLWLGQLTFNFSNPSIVYGQPDIEFGHTGLVRSTDGMETWDIIGDGIPSAQVSNVAVHPLNPDIIITSRNIGHFPHITRDGGETWSRVPDVGNMGDELVIDPNNPGHMILVTESTFFSRHGMEDTHGIDSRRDSHQPEYPTL